MTSNFEFDGSLAPNVLRVQDIQHVAWFDLFDTVRLFPFLVVLNSLVVSLELIGIALLLIAHQLIDGRVNHARMLHVVLPYVLSAVGAFFFPNQSLIDANFTE